MAFNRDQEPSAEEKHKFLAEAEAQRALARKYEAEIEYFKDYGGYYRAQSEYSSIGVESAKIDLERKRREEAEGRAAFKFRNIFHFWTDVNDADVAEAVKKINIMDQLDPHCDIRIIFSSPGGSIVDGFIFYDYIQQLRRKGHKVTTSTLGYAASMAGILLQAGDVRIMAKESWLLIHEATFGAGGKLGDVEDRVAWVKRMCLRIMDIFAERASAKTGKTANEIKALIKKNWTRRDWWISSDEALKYGFVDEVE